MALSESALSELLEAFRTGDGVDMIRESVRTVLQELVEFEAAGAIGAATRSLMFKGVRWNWRRGHRREFLVLALRWGRFDGEMEALGLGDVSLGLAAGACLGFPAVLVGLAPAAAFGALGYLYRRSCPVHLDRARELGIDPQAIPFGPFLCVGFLAGSWLLKGGFPQFVP